MNTGLGSFTGAKLHDRAVIALIQTVAFNQDHLFRSLYNDCLPWTFDAKGIKLRLVAQATNNHRPRDNRDTELSMTKKPVPHVTRIRGASHSGRGPAGFWRWR